MILTQSLWSRCFEYVSKDSVHCDLNIEVDGVISPVQRKNVPKDATAFFLFYPCLWSWKRGWAEVGHGGLMVLVVFHVELEKLNSSCQGANDGPRAGWLTIAKLCATTLVI